VPRMPGPGGIPVYDKNWPQICWELWLGGVLLNAGAGTRAAVAVTVWVWMS